MHFNTKNYLKSTRNHTAKHSVRPMNYTSRKLRQYGLGDKITIHQIPRFCILLLMVLNTYVSLINPSLVRWHVLVIYGYAS